MLSFILESVTNFKRGVLNMYKVDDLFNFMKEKLTMNYLYTNAYLKKEKKNYPIGFTLINFLLALLVFNLPIFLVPEDFDVPLGTFGGMNLSGNQNIMILWAMLGMLLVTHLLAYRFQHQHNLFMMGRINLPTIIGILWVFLFQEKMRSIAVLLFIFTGFFYLIFFIDINGSKMK